MRVRKKSQRRRDLVGRATGVESGCCSAHPTTQVTGAAALVPPTLPEQLGTGRVSARGAESQRRRFKGGLLGFPGGTVVKNLPANAGDTGSIPGPGRSHMSRSS